MSASPARTFGFRQKGTLDIGTDADLVVFDLNREYTITASDNASKADFLIYERQLVAGAVVKTFVRGQLVGDERDIVAEPYHGESSIESQSSGNHSHTKRRPLSR